MAVYPYNNVYTQYQQPNYYGYQPILSGQQLGYSGYTTAPPSNQQQNYANYATPAYAAQNQQPQHNTGIVWVQGEAGAKAYLVGAGQSVLLMDSENSSFYIKSTDASGVPLPLRVFDYIERGQQPERTSAAAQVQSQDYVTRDELKQWSDKLRSSILKESRQDGRKSTV